MAAQAVLATITNSNSKRHFHYLQVRKAVSNEVQAKPIGLGCDHPDSCQTSRQPQGAGRKTRVEVGNAAAERRIEGERPAIQRPLIVEVSELR